MERFRILVPNLYQNYLKHHLPSNYFCFPSLPKRFYLHSAHHLAQHIGFNLMSSAPSSFTIRAFCQFSPQCPNMTTLQQTFTASRLNYCSNILPGPSTFISPFPHPSNMIMVVIVFDHRIHTTFQ